MTEEQPTVVTSGEPPPPTVPPQPPPRKRVFHDRPLWQKALIVVVVVYLGTVIYSAMTRSSGSPPGSGGQTDPGYVSRAMLGDDWPLTVEDGILRCEPASRVIFETGGTKYAVNGVAVSAGYADIGPIWAADATGAAPKKNIGPLIERGLALC